ncbi:alpha/beta fold hydrolase [Pseudoroseicyclus sp. CXY001]|uniref:alpha/beta fold hydrolase n=1 Tax=Pseudoroseicyclus sp. CXY001 TaxID=3242492 RepID=UPI00358DB9E7
MIWALGVLAAAVALVALGVRRQRARAEAACPPVGRLIEVDGLKVHVLEAGRGPAVILIHGAGGNLRNFSFDLMARLAPQFRVIAFDRPGLGHSAPLPGHPAPADQARHLAKAAAQLGAAPAVIVGHSFGAAVALGWPRDGSAAAIVTLGGAMMPYDGPLSSFYAATGSWWGRWTTAPLMSVFARKRDVARALGGIFAPQTPPPGYVEAIGAPLTLRRRSLAENGRQVRGLSAALHLMAPDYPSLGIPVEVVHGLADSTCGADLNARGIASCLPRATLTLLPGVGHMPHHADPEATQAAITRAARSAGLI